MARSIVWAMPIFERGQIVRVPFPYADRDIRRARPALVVSEGAIGERQRVIWVAMITGAANRRWPGDVDITDDPPLTGLPIPSVVRTTKVATIDISRAEPVGKVSSRTSDEVAGLLKSYL